MATTIPVGFVDKFSGDLIMLSQQVETRLWNRCRRDPNMLMGRFGYFDRIGALSMTKRTGRNQDTNISEAPWSRRRITLGDYELGQLLDKQDMARLDKPQTQARLLQTALAAANRQKDDIVIAAALGNSYGMDEDMLATPIALPNAQKIAVNLGGANSGLTIAKLLAAREQKEKVELLEDEKWQIAITSHEITNLLNVTEVKSKDYNTVQALAEGKINNYMGFDFVRTERLSKTGAIVSCIAWATSGIGLAVAEELGVDIGPRRDKGGSNQLLVTMSADATRVEDEKVIQIDCDQSV